MHDLPRRRRPVPSPTNSADWASLVPDRRRRPTRPIRADPTCDPLAHNQDVARTIFPFESMTEALRALFTTSGLDTMGRHGDQRKPDEQQAVP